MRKIVAVLLSALLLCGILPFTASASEVPYPQNDMIITWPEWTSKWFATTDEAALDFALTYMIFTLTEDVEFGTTIYRKFDWKTFRLGYSYSEPIRGEKNSVMPFPPFWIILCPLFYASNIHTHPNGSGGNFSGQDLDNLEEWAWFFPLENIYVVGPNGTLQRCDRITRTSETIYTDLDFYARYA